jgi:hypothetical protein
MAQVKVEDLVRNIRERDREGTAAKPDFRSSTAGYSAKTFARLRSSVATANRTRDQLPPLTTYRSGLSARIELWIKRQLKRATHWYTWQQVTFNSAVNDALNQTLTALSAFEQNLATIQSELEVNAVSTANLELRLTEFEASFESIETRLTKIVGDRLEEMQVEEQKGIALLLDEQRACFKQLKLEISETGVVADRAKRSLQLRLDELNSRIEEIRSDKN